MLQTEVRLLLIASDEITDALEDLQLYNQRCRQGFTTMRNIFVHLSGHCDILVATAQQDISELHNNANNTWHGNAWWTESLPTVAAKGTAQDRDA